MKYKFCPKCGSKLIMRDSLDEGKVPYCPFDDIMYFDLPKPCVVVAVIKDDKILLLKQSYIFKNSKVLVSGYVTNGESVEETVSREVREETGITVGNIKYLGSDFIEQSELLMLTYMAEYVKGELNKSDEVEYIEWSYIEDAISQMKEDRIGKAVVKKVLKEKGYAEQNIYVKSNDYKYKL